ncbi:hypothetical protein P3S68_001847 [Capsicum galapagoense]
MKGSYKIGAYDNHNVSLDFSIEEEFKNVWFRRVIEIEGMQMWLQKWSPDFKPKEDIPVAPVWILLPGLPFNMHNWHYVKQILSSVGTPLALDVATASKTRPSMAKVRVEIDLLKPRIESVWVGKEDENSPLKGFTQKLEYEAIPKYCKHCKKLGHNMLNCRVLERLRAKETLAYDGKEVVDNLEGAQLNNKESDNANEMEIAKNIQPTLVDTQVNTNENAKDQEEEAEKNNDSGPVLECGQAQNKLKSVKVKSPCMAERTKNKKKKKNKTKKMLKKKSTVIFKLV